MIIEGLLGLIQRLLELLLNPIHIPDLPSNVQTVIDQACTYFADGLGIFAAFTHFNFIMSLLVLVISIDAAMMLYKFIRWILQKIPMASIE